ncbi:DEAD/DEAH box helicase [Corynebacterium sp. Marseille-P4321]|uniref:DEAD/DEAH box helicase n=1 Tax=Corynebacterium sp. Marseille-P4321 TaxID=2736603 RepID=UPI001588ABE5|nr:DEAD/DEAH box helicase [Corynebacterium sp. Marseille-P4321]
MPKFLLHGLWLSETGLAVWAERVEGHRIVTISQVPEGTFPPVVHSLLDDSRFRHRQDIVLQTPRGRQVTLRAPVAVFAPEEAVRFLASLAFLDGPSPAATPAQRESVAPDMYWLLRMYNGLVQFAQAGRVSIHVPYRHGQWFAQWQLGTGVEERGWLAEMLAAAPGVLTVNNPNLSEDCAQTFTHWITSALLYEPFQEASQRRPYPWHDFVFSLVFGTPLRRGGAQLAKQVSDWNGTITAVNLQLVFVTEPPEDPVDGSTDAEEGALVTREVLWPVRVQVRSGTDAPRPVRLSDYDSVTAEALRDELSTAVEVTPLVDPWVRGWSRRSPGTVPDAGAGDWDVLLTSDEIVDFVTRAATALRVNGFAVMLPRAWSTAETTSKLHVTRASDPHDSSTVSMMGLDTLMRYDWRLSVGGVELSDEEMAELVRSKSGLVKLRGEWVLANTREIEKTKKYLESLKNTSVEEAKREAEAAETRARLAEAAGSDDAEELAAAARAAREHYEQLKEAEGTGEVPASALRQLALEAGPEQPVEFTGSPWFTSLMGGADRPAPERVELPETVQAELRDYQRRGVDWLYFMSRNNVGAVLADDMGLGKTLQLLTLLAVEEAEGKKTGPTLVVAPTSVVGNWAREAARFVPGMKVMVHHGPARAKGDELFADIEAADLVITSYGTISRDVQDFSRVRWDHVVLDEAQAIKNAGTQASKSVRALPSRHRIALTGTPIENKLSELRSILDFVNPGMLGSQTFFRNHFAKAIESQRDPVLAEEMGQRLQRLTASFILRRLKTDTTIIEDLPDKDEHVVAVDMTSEQAALYKALVDEMKRELENRQGIARKGLVLATITRIKQICNHPAHFLGDGSPVTVKGKPRSGKVEKLMELLATAAETGQRVLIFTQYKAFGDILQPYLSDRLGEDVPFLHGGVGKNARDRMVERFQSPDGPQAMLLSLKAGGTGLNLTAASMVIHLDRWWNPAVENQATDRAFRIGQDKDVTVYKLITKGTMEESIQDILDGKTQLAGAVVGQGEGWITELDTDELAQLISYRGRDE